VATLQNEIAHETRSIKMRLTMKPLAKIQIPSIDITQCQHANKKIEKKVEKKCEFAHAKFSPKNKKLTTSF
jgi:hypothetical protein